MSGWFNYFRWLKKDTTPSCNLINLKTIDIQSCMNETKSSSKVVMVNNTVTGLNKFLSINKLA